MLLNLPTIYGKRENNMKYLLMLLTLASCKLPSASTNDGTTADKVEYNNETNSVGCVEVSDDGVYEIQVTYTRTSNDVYSTLEESIECIALENGQQVGYDKAEFGFCTFSIQDSMYQIEFNDMVGQITQYEGSTNVSWQLSCEQL
jgi:hypothetical protein